MRNGRTGALLSKWEPPIQNKRVGTYVSSVDKVLKMKLGKDICFPMVKSLQFFNIGGSASQATSRDFIEI